MTTGATADLSLSEQAGGGLPGTPVVFEVCPDLDPVFSGELMNAVNRGVQKLGRLPGAYSPVLKYWSTA